MKGKEVGIISEKIENYSEKSLEKWNKCLGDYENYLK